MIEWYGGGMGGFVGLTAVALGCARLLLEADKNGVLIGMVDQNGRTALHHVRSVRSHWLDSVL